MKPGWIWWRKPKPEHEPCKHEMFHLKDGVATCMECFRPLPDKRELAIEFMLFEIYTSVSLAGRGFW